MGCEFFFFGGGGGGATAGVMVLGGSFVGDVTSGGELAT